MPKMGDGMEEGTLVEWLKKDGDKVKSGEVIGTIQTDKATLELESPGSGILGGLLIADGDTVPVGRPIAAILKQGESLPAQWGSPTEHSGTAPEPKAQAKEDVPEVEEPTAENHERVKASPLARRIAHERGLDIAGIAGTGPGGRIVERDVQAAKPTARPASAGPATDTPVKLNRLRTITAQRTVHAKQEVPHFYLTVETDVEAIIALRGQFEKEGSGKVSINDFVIKACAMALQEMPEVNATFAGENVLRHASVHVGMAVAVPDGLTVPVMHHVETLTLRHIAEASRDLAQKARDNKLMPDELSGSTFSISNMGMLNVDNFVAIINEPNAAIVAVSTAKRQAVVADNGDIVARMRMNVTFSFDHRVVDGAVGARFANVVRGYLENPTRLLA